MTTHGLGSIKLVFEPLLRRGSKFSCSIGGTLMIKILIFFNYQSYFAKRSIVNNYVSEGRVQCVKHKFCTAEKNLLRLRRVNW
jgi:hypothetical protein